MSMWGLTVRSPNGGGDEKTGTVRSRITEWLEVMEKLSTVHNTPGSGCSDNVPAVNDNIVSGDQWRVAFSVLLGG